MAMGLIKKRKPSNSALTPIPDRVISMGALGSDKTASDSAKSKMQAAVKSGALGAGKPKSNMQSAVTGGAIGPDKASSKMKDAMKGNVNNPKMPIDKFMKMRNGR